MIENNNSLGVPIHIKTKKPAENSAGFLLLWAEREGFEPPVPLSTAVFKTAVIDHSTISPNVIKTASGLKASAKVVKKVES